MRTEQSMEKEQNHIDEEKLNSFRRHCRDSEVVFIDAWSPGTEEHQVSDEELLPGEIEAVTFQIGCYTARSNVIKLVAIFLWLDSIAGV